MVFFQNRDKGWAGQICISLEISRKVKKEKFRGLLKGSSVGVKTKSNKNIDLTSFFLLHFS